MQLHVFKRYRIMSSFSGMKKFSFFEPGLPTPYQYWYGAQTTQPHSNTDRYMIVMLTIKNRIKSVGEGITNQLSLKKPEFFQK
jgi:hypothetical protein